MMALEGRRVFVTGATGFIGGAVALRLAAEGARVTGLARDPARAGFLSEAGVEVVQGDIGDPERLRAQVAGAEVVFHLAALAGVATHARMAAVNIWGTDNVLQAARDAGVARFVHVSTISVYGYTRRGVVDETARLHPIGEGYGDTKAIGERLALRSGLPATVVRPAQVYGPRSQPWTVRLIDLTRWFVPLVDGGRGTCHPIYIDDIVDLLVLAAHHPDAPGQVFNGSPDPPPTWRDFLTGYGRMHGHSRVVSVPRWLLALPLGVAEGAFRLTDRRLPVRTMLNFLTADVTYSNRKAREVLGWTPRVDLAEGMRRSEAWLRAHGHLPPAVQ